MAQAFLAQCGKMVGKIDAAGNRCQNNHPFNQRRIKISDTVVVRGKSAQRKGGHGVAQRVKPRHSGFVQRDKNQPRRHQIQQPQPLGRLRNARCHFVVFFNAGNFRFKKLRAAHAQHGQHSHGQHDNPHATQPVEHVPPEIQRGRDIVQPPYHRCARGGQPAHCLEKGIGKR